MIHQVNNCLFAFNESHDIVLREYYLYSIELFKKACINSNLQANFIFGDYHFPFSNDNPVIKVGFQHEHTLVKPGGRGSNGHPQGKIPINGYENSSYLIRIDRYNCLNSMDIVVEYSLPNIHNIKSSGLFDKYVAKNIYIAPLLFTSELNKTRNRDCFTSFINTSEPRRRKLLDNIASKKLNSTNINNKFNKEELLSIYHNYKILINIRQTDHHDTLEELRILSALANGVIVISEDAPLKELVPYQDLIVWSDYSSIADKAQEVLDNYQRYRDSIFNSHFSDRIFQLEGQNLETVGNKLKEFFR